MASRRDPATTRSRIETAALALFAEKGIAVATTREIAERAGVAEGALFKHFRSRDNLIAEIFRTHWAELAERIETIAREAPGDARDRVAAIIEHLCRLFDANHALFSFLILAQHAALPRIEPGAASPIDVLIRIIADGMAKHEIRADEPSLLAATVVGIVAQPATFILYGRLAAPMAANAQALANATRRLLQP
jgi:AcrR family transcriptional regulator